MKLTTRQKNLLEKHSEHHSDKHMEFMKRRMRAGDTFTQAHKKRTGKGGKMKKKDPRLTKNRLEDFNKPKKTPKSSNKISCGFS